MKSRTLIKTILCVGILLYLSGIVQCQRRTGTLPLGTGRTGTRTLQGGLGSPVLRLRNMGTLPASQLSNQTSSRSGSPRLLGFIIPSASGGRPQLRLMPGAQDFIRPGRRIAAAPISQLSRFGGAQTNSALSRGRGVLSAAQTLTGMPSNMLSQARNDVVGGTRGGQIRRLPQSALNTIAAARGQAPTREPNIVFVRPPASVNRASGLSPEMIRRIRLAALQRAESRGATAGRGGLIQNVVMPQGGAIGIARQPQTLNRAPQTLNRMPIQRAIQTTNRAPLQTSIRGSETQIRMTPDATTRRRVSTTGFGGTSAPRQVRPVPQSTFRTEVLRPSPRSPARVDEAVLRANIVPAGLSSGSNGIRGVLTSSSSSSSDTTTSSSTSSSESRRISSGSSISGIGGLVQTGIQVQPAATVIAPAPELEFRTALGGDSSGTAVIAPTGVIAPVLDSGPTFEVISGDPSSVILGPGTRVSESLSLDVGAASGPALVASPTVISSGAGIMAAAAPVEEATIVQGGAALPIGDTAVIGSVGPSVASMVPVGGSDAQMVAAVPAAGPTELTGIGAIVPNAANLPSPVAASNPDLNSLKSVITDVLRDMAASGKTSNVQPDISAMARAVLEAQQSKGNHVHTESQPKIVDLNNRKPIVQTFTLTPTNPSIIINPDPTSISSPTISNNNQQNAGLQTSSLHKVKTEMTAHPTVSHTASANPNIIDVGHQPLDSFHTHGIHDIVHDHGNFHGQQALHDHLHDQHHPHDPHHPHDLHHLHDLHHPHDLHQDSGFSKATRQTESQLIKIASSATTQTPVSTKSANEQMNLIVGDWSGAEKTLTGNPPPPPPKHDLALEHPHGHHHIETHVHGFIKPSIPPPPPMSAVDKFTQPVRMVDIHPTDPSLNHSASSASDQTVLNQAVTGHMDNTNGLLDIIPTKTNFQDPNAGPLLHDVSHSLNDAMHAVSDPGKSVHDPGHNLSAGNAKDLNLTFINILEKNLNQHLGKYKSALVYLYDPLNGKIQEGNSLDIIEIALNLTDLPWQVHTDAQHSENQTQHANTGLDTAKSNLPTEYVPPAAKGLLDITTAANLKQTQIDSINLINTHKMLQTTTASMLDAAGVKSSNDTVNMGSLNLNITTSNENVTSSVEATVLSANYSSSANKTLPLVTTESIVFTTDLTTIVGSTTVDPDYLADLAEAKEEAAQIARELAEAGEVMTTTSITTAGATALAMTGSTAAANNATNSVKAIA